MNEPNRVGLSTFALKLIAVLTMLIDHTAAVFYMELPGSLYTLMRCIGRLAFPVYCFLLVEGFFYTRSREKYILRLMFFCLVSEPFYDLAFHRTYWYAASQNVFWTLLIGFLLMIALDALWQRAKGKKLPVRFGAGALGVVFLAAACLLAAGLHTDYSYKGVLFIACFWLLRKWRVAAVLSMAVVNLVFRERINNLWNSILAGTAPEFTLRFLIQDTAVLACFPLLLYNGKKGRSMRWFFYLFYPVHLLMLSLLRAAAGL